MSKHKKTRIELIGNLENLVVQQITKKTFERYASIGIPTYERNEKAYLKFREKFDDNTWFCGLSVNSNLRLFVNDEEVKNAYDMISDEVSHTFQPIERLNSKYYYLAESLYCKSGVWMTETTQKFDPKNLAIHIERYKVLDEDDYSIVSATYNNIDFEFSEDSGTQYQDMYLVHNGTLTRLPSTSK